MGKYWKFIVAALTAGLIAAQNVLPMSDAARGWVTVVLAALGAVGVFAVKNDPMPSDVQGARRWPPEAGQ